MGNPLLACVSDFEFVDGFRAGAGGPYRNDLQRQWQCRRPKSDVQLVAYR